MSGQTLQILSYNTLYLLYFLSNGSKSCSITKTGFTSTMISLCTCITLIRLKFSSVLVYAGSSREYVHRKA